MLYLQNLLASTFNDRSFKDDNLQVIFYVILAIFLIIMAVSALTAIVLILMQPSNSSGIDALGGSSETFFGKNKGKSIEAKMKKWTWICLAVIVVSAICVYVNVALPFWWS